MSVMQRYVVIATYPLWCQERVDSLLRQEHAIGLAAEVREFDPCHGVVFGTQNQCANLQDTLPYFHVWLTTLKSLIDE